MSALIAYAVGIFLAGGTLVFAWWTMIDWILESANLENDNAYRKD